MYGSLFIFPAAHPYQKRIYTLFLTKLAKSAWCDISYWSYTRGTWFSVLHTVNKYCILKFLCWDTPMSWIPWIQTNSTVTFYTKQSIEHYMYFPFNVRPMYYKSQDISSMSLQVVFVLQAKRYRYDTWLPGHFIYTCDIDINVWNIHVKYCNRKSQ